MYIFTQYIRRQLTLNKAEIKDRIDLYDDNRETFIHFRKN